MYTIEDIVHHTGITNSKAMEICNLLCSEGYLIFSKETGRYRLTKDRDLLNNLRKLRKQYKDEHLFEQMCNKIENIITFGKPLALSEKCPGVTVKDIGIPGLNIIFNRNEAVKNVDKNTRSVQRIPGVPVGHCFLIKGEPGTGKTTMGMQIALYLKDNRSRFLTFEEDMKQLFNDFKGYLQEEDNPGNRPVWKESYIKEVTRSLIKIRTPSAWEDPDVVLNELISILDRELPHIIVIDSISRIRDIGGETKSRLFLRKLIRNLKCRRITAFFTGEDRGEENSFEEYEVDGIIHLKWDGELLTLKVKKLRGLKSYKGPHSAEMMSVDDLELPEHRLISNEGLQERYDKNSCLTVGLNVFPDISVFKDFRPQKAHYPIAAIGTGTDGLDDLLPLLTPEGEKKGFKRGETILLVGSAGSGKTLLALNFMLDGYNKSKNENTIWINFEGDLETLKFATSGFEDPLKSNYEEMLKLGKNEETQSRFEFIDFPPINLDLNKIVFTLQSIWAKYGKIDRLVIDSITELEKARGGGQPAVKVFLTGLIQFLRDRHITTIFVCRSDAFFKSIDKIEEQISSLVDLIICIRNFDVHNQIQKGIYIQKARGRQHNSKIIRLIIDSKDGIKVEDSGWDIENLLAGDASNIEIPKIFFKLFYENPAEEAINQEIINDFNKERYPGDDPNFTLVRKSSIYTEFWSFGGQFSAGHANTRVLSIADYVLSAFRDNDRLLKLKNYIKSELLQNIASMEHLKRLYSSSQKIGEQELDPENIDAIPCYRDYGVMVFKKESCFRGSLTDENVDPNQQSLLDELNNFLINQPEIGEDDNDWLKTGYKWDKLLKILGTWNKKNNKDGEKKKQEKKKGKKYKFVPFAFPPLDNRAEFVAFFMELLWSYGGDIYEIPIGEKHLSTGYENKFKKAIKNSVLKEYLLYFKELYKQRVEPGAKQEKIISTFDKSTTHTTAADTQSLEKEFEMRFDIYGLKSKKIELEKFRQWIEENLNDLELRVSEFENIEQEIGKKSVLKLNDKPFKETVKLILRLIHQGGIKKKRGIRNKVGKIFKRNNKGIPSPCDFRTVDLFLP